MVVKVHLNTLLLKNNFAISHGAYSYREQMVVELDASGMQGFGETVAIDYYGITIGSLHNKAKSIIQVIEKTPITTSTSDFYKQLLRLLPDDPFVRCAFDCAYIDLKSQLAEQSIREFCNIDEKEKAQSSITLGLADSEKLLEQRLHEPWPIYKVKINTQDRSDLYRKIIDNNKLFGVDANGSLDLGQAQKIAHQLQEHRAVYGEQLMDKMSTTEIDSFSLPENIFHLADEAIYSLDTAKRISQYYDGFVLKLTKCGGITPVLEIIKYAKQNNKKLLAGCMTESSIGINNMLSLLPLFDYADLDGAFLISNDEEVCSIDAREKRQLQPNGTFSHLD